MQPLLRPIRPVRLMAQFCLKLSYPFFGPSKVEPIVRDSFPRPSFVWAIVLMANLNALRLEVVPVV